MRKLILTLLLFFVLGGIAVAAQNDAQVAAPGAAAPAAAPAAAKPAVQLDPIGLDFAIAGLVVVAIAALVLGKKTDMLRDSEPTDFGGERPSAGGVYRRPYSLAQTQMTWWFCIVLASFIYIVCATATHTIIGVLVTQALILMGIGTGTALGAAMIEQTKDDKPGTLKDFKDALKNIQAAQAAGVAPAPADIATRARLAPKLASENVIKDILTDADGISLHRFQSVAWTLVLGILFLAESIAYTKMPEFDANVLAVLGISAGTYLGFKIPEKPA
ncbi:MAG TPA: hypothetical protein VNH44_07390 [Micropepsaceae bacterium]|nr:hypothetical protein [Micropepsaceae bacterium]